MDNGKQENTPNDATSPQVDVLTDLPVADEQADETKGGATPKLFLHCASGQH